MISMRLVWRLQCGSREEQVGRRKILWEWRDRIHRSTCRSGLDLSWWSNREAIRSRMRPSISKLTTRRQSISIRPTKRQEITSWKSRWERKITQKCPTANLSRTRAHFQDNHTDSRLVEDWICPASSYRARCCLSRLGLLQKYFHQKREPSVRW